MIALIPARAGSKRIPGKNTRLLAGHPVIAYTIAAATASGVFDRIVVYTDDARISALMAEWGVTWQWRKPVLDLQPDIEWVRVAMGGAQDESFAILRPTSPFRSAEHIRQAYARFQELGQSIDSLRAVRKVTEHPGKMWEVTPLAPLMTPLRTSLGIPVGPAPAHSRSTQSLPSCYVQTSSLEMAWTRVLHESGTISGTRIAPWIVEDYNGFSLDTLDDWAKAEAHAADGSWPLPAVDVARVSPASQAV